MLFDSLEFLIFYFIVAYAYFNVPQRDRWMLLTGASYYFYSRWSIPFLGLIIASTLIDYHVAKRLPLSASPTAKRRLLYISLAGNLGLLFFFKYYNFVTGSLNAALLAMGAGFEIPPSALPLPVGISFYTFQTLSYTLEVFFGRQQPEGNVGNLALYVAFFPQLVAGPIERPQHLLHQLTREARFDYERAVTGLQLMLWGYFKKMVIADNLGIIVDRIYASPGQYDGPTLAAATVFFAFQIFCDFSGYSDIAIGSARLLGIDLMKNFERPYFAKSIPEFWQRWHISLSTWFRDYVYIPLGGNRASRPVYYRNLLIVFLVSGLWHGASWTFVVWGLLHFIYYAASVSTRDFREKATYAIGFRYVPLIHKAFQIACTFSLVCFSWIFFRAESMSAAWLIVTKLPTGWSAQGLFENFFQQLLLPDPFPIATGVTAILILEAYHWLERTQDNMAALRSKPAWVRWSFYYAAALCILGFGEMGSRQFIYFQF